MAAETDWELLENTLAAAARVASGLPVGKVLWEGQTLPSGLSNASVPGSGRPALPYLTLFRDAEDCLSFVPEVRASDNPAAVPGHDAGTWTQTAGAPETPEGEEPAPPSVVLSMVGAKVLPPAPDTGGLWLEIVDGPTVIGHWGDEGLPLTLEEGELHPSQQWPQLAGVVVRVVGEFTAGDMFEFASAPVAGTELLVDYDTPAEFQVRLQAFTSEVRGNNAAAALLSKAHAYFLTDAGRDALRPVGLAVIEVGTVQNLTGLVETRMEGRAALDLRVRFVDGAQQASTFISSVEITPTLDGTPGTPFTVTEPEEG